MGSSHSSGRRTCLAGGCQWKALSRGHYCVSHTCSDDACYNRTYGTSCCEEHQTGGASSPEDEDSNSDDSDNGNPTCGKSICSNDAMSDSEYCAIHTCEHSGCTEPIASLSSEYCFEHAMCVRCQQDTKYKDHDECYDCYGAGLDNQTTRRLQRRIDRVEEGEDSPDEEFWEDLRDADSRGLDVTHQWNLDDD